jgi:hypothetical protein
MVEARRWCWKMAVVLGLCEVVLGGGLRLQWRHWAMAAAERHARMTPASALLKPRAYYYDIHVSLDKDGMRRRVQCKGCMSAVMATR